MEFVGIYAPQKHMCLKSFLEALTPTPKTTYMGPLLPVNPHPAPFPESPWISNTVKSSNLLAAVYYESCNHRFLVTAGFWYWSKSLWHCLGYEKLKDEVEKVLLKAPTPDQEKMDQQFTLLELLCKHKEGQISSADVAEASKKSKRWIFSFFTIILFF